MCNTFGGPEKPFPASKHIFDTSGQMSHHFMTIQECKKQQFQLKNVQNSISFKVAGSVRTVIIWPGMSIWGIVGLFCTEIRYLNIFWKDFKKFEKKSIFEILICGSPDYEYRNFNFPAKYRPYDIGGIFKHLRTLSKPKCPSP